MKLNIQRRPLSKKILRKMKLNKIIKNNIQGQSYIGYDWQLGYDNKNENLQDLHLFCISIVKDLFEKNFKTNDGGSITYKGVEFNSENTKLQLHQLFCIIENEQIKKLKNDH